MMMAKNSKLAMAALALTLSLVTGACGAASESESETASGGVASLTDDGQGGGSSDGDDPDAPRDPDAAHTLYAKCMKDAGFNVDAGSGDGGIVIGEAPANADNGDGSTGGMGDQYGEEFFKAADECEKHLANIDLDFNVSPEEKAARDDAMLAYSKCMEEHGFAVSSMGDGDGIDVDGPGDGDDPDGGMGSGGFDDDDFDALTEADEKCIHHLTDLDDGSGN